jgi:hypothetical protein
MTISGDLIDVADEYNKFLNNIITADETWCFLYDPKKKASSEWKSSPPPPPPPPHSKKFRVGRAKGNIMFLKVSHPTPLSGMVHYGFIPEGKMVSGKIYRASIN